MHVSFLLYFLASACIGYFMGSIPYGLLLTRFNGVHGLQEKGSGNIGATNVYRIAGRKLGFLTLALDYLKGLLTVLLCLYLDLDIYVAGICCVLGHIFPVWLKFKGGKGVASYMGVITAWGFFPGLLATFIWLGILVVTRISSLASLSCVVSSLFFLGLWTEGPAVFFAMALAFIIFFKHTGNIKRLIIGKEK